VTDDEKIIELFFARSEQGIRELDNKYGKICRKLSAGILHDQQDAEEVVRVVSSFICGEDVTVE